MSAGDFGELSDDDDEIIINEDDVEPYSIHTDKFTCYLNQLMKLVDLICFRQEPQINIICAVINDNERGLQRLNYWTSYFNPHRNTAVFSLAQKLITVDSLKLDHAYIATIIHMKSQTQTLSHKINNPDQFRLRLSQLDLITSVIMETADFGIIHCDYPQELLNLAAENDIVLYVDPEDGPPTLAYPFIFTYNICTTNADDSAMVHEETTGQGMHEDFPALQLLRLLMVHGANEITKQKMASEFESQDDADNNLGYQILSSIVV